jgi:hypothetical protein
MEGPPTGSNGGSPPMDKFRFSLILRGIDALRSDHIDRVYAHGCSDAVFGARDGAPFADFARESKSFPTAVMSAIEQIESAVPDAQVVRVAPDDLVNLTEIATRTGRSKESIRLLAEGRRGPGGFPAPVAWIGGTHRIWQWSDVAHWFSERLGEGHSEGEAAQFVAALNGALEVRWRSAQLSTSDERAGVAKILAG